MDSRDFSKWLTKGVIILATLLSAAAQIADALGKAEQGTLLNESAKAATEAAPVIGAYWNDLTRLILSIFGPLLAFMKRPVWFAKLVNPR